MITCDTKDRVDAVSKGTRRIRFFPDSRQDVFVTRFSATARKVPGQRTASTELLRSFRGKPTRRRSPSRVPGTRGEHRGGSGLNADGTDKASVHVIDAIEHRSPPYEV